VWLIQGYRVLVALLGLTIGLAELSVLSSAELSSRQPDPVLLLVSEQTAVAAGAVLLLAAAVLAAFPGNPEIRWAGIFLTGVVLAAYQLTRLLFGVPEPCQCLGTVAKLSGLNSAGVAVLKYAVIGILVIPSAGFLQWSRAKPLGGN
jgi:hypothetical protein